MLWFVYELRKDARMNEFDFFINEDDFQFFADVEVGFDDADPGLVAWAEAQLSYWG